LNFLFIFSSYLYSYKNEQKAFSEKSDRSNRLTTFRLRRYRKNMRVQKKITWNGRPKLGLWPFEFPFSILILFSTHLRMSKRRFPKNRPGQTALRQFGCVAIEKIRGFKKKIGWNGHPKPELWQFEVSQIRSYLQSLRILRKSVTSDSNVLSAQFFFWFLVFLRDLFEKLIPCHWISFLLFRHISMSKRRFLKNRLARTASRRLGRVDIEKIRRFKKKSPETDTRSPSYGRLSFPFSRLPSIFKMLNFRMIVTFGSNVLLTQFFFW